MTTELLLKGFFALIISGTLSWCVYSQGAPLLDLTNPSDRQRYLPLVSGLLLPLSLFVLFVLAVFPFGFAGAAEEVLSLCFGIFLHILLYYVVLLAILPLLREHFSAQACALLWLIPNYLYITQYQTMKIPMPLLVFYVSGQVIQILAAIWAIGFAGVLGWKMLSHLVFRFHILKDAVPVTDPEMLAVWDHEIQQGNFKKPKFRLVSSPQVTTPLSIGLISRKTRVVLPQHTYSPEELSLILRHELVHIGRQDCWSKFFLVFCTAMCWFNPLMWLAMRKSADDLELSCDEIVLEGCNSTTRYQYANLLLKTAGDQRGFTTCLSTTASALRYRLKHVMSPPPKHSGALLVGITFFFLCMTCGYVALAYGNDTGAQAIYQSRDTSDFSLRDITLDHDPYHTIWLCPDQEKFHHFMASLELANLTGSYSFDGAQQRFTFLYDIPEGEYSLAVILQDNALKVVPLGDQDRSPQWYYIPKGTDWAKLDEILLACPALNLDFCNPESKESHQMGATLYQLDETLDGQTTSLIVPETPLEEANGIFEHDLSYTEVALDFSYPLTNEFTVIVESWDKTTSYRITQSQLDNPSVVPLAAYPAHYTLYATLEGKNGSTFEAIFRFDYGEH